MIKVYSRKLKNQTRLWAFYNGTVVLSSISVADILINIRYPFNSPYRHFFTWQGCWAPENFWKIVFIRRNKQQGFFYVPCNLKDIHDLCKYFYDILTQATIHVRRLLTFLKMKELKQPKIFNIETSCNGQSSIKSKDK